MEHDMEETKVIMIDNIQPVYMDLISEMDIHAEQSEDIGKRSQEFITVNLNGSGVQEKTNKEEMNKLTGTMLYRRSTANPNKP